MILPIIPPVTNNGNTAISNTNPKNIKLYRCLAYIAGLSELIKKIIGKIDENIIISYRPS